MGTLRLYAATADQVIDKLSSVYELKKTVKVLHITMPTIQEEITPEQHQHLVTVAKSLSHLRHLIVDDRQRSGVLDTLLQYVPVSAWQKLKRLSLLNHSPEAVKLLAVHVVPHLKQLDA